MITEKDMIKCEAIFNDDRTHRFLWRRVWSKDKPLACVVMLNPCLADTIITDTTTSLVVNNIARLETYGGVEIVNLYSLLTNKLNFRWNSDEMLNDKENDTYIKKSAEACDTVILAWGTGAACNKRMLGGMSKIYCAECGSAMVGAANKSHGKTHRYYVCPKHKQKSCKLKNLRADYLEKLLCVTIVHKTLNKNNYTRYNDLLKESAGKKPGKGICRELAGVKKAIDNILKVLETHPTDEAMEHFSSLTAKKDALQSRVDAVNNVPQITPDNLKNLRIQLAKELKNSSDPLTYDIIDKIVKRVTVGKDNIEIELHI